MAYHKRVVTGYEQDVKDSGIQKVTKIWLTTSG